MSTKTVQSIATATQLGPVIIRVADAARSLDFYQTVLGFKRLDDRNGVPALGAGSSSVVILKEVPRALPARRASGLYHFAVLVPSRAALGQALRRLAEAQIGIGEADHLVSEALYLSDPDGNGIEIYRDRPRSEWKWSNGTVQMATEPLDLEDLLREGDIDTSPAKVFPEGTRIGHVHLQVSDVEEAVRFYHGILGFDITATWQGAAFLSAGGYHHHLGLNSWASRGAPPAPEGSTGLESFGIQVPDAAELARIEKSLHEAGVAASMDAGVLRSRDPWNIGLEIQA
ncbi:MAG: VOC family protein [Spirochaetia bacterium]